MKREDFNVGDRLVVRSRYGTLFEVRVERVGMKVVQLRDHSGPHWYTFLDNTYCDSHSVEHWQLVEKLTSGEGEFTR